MTYSNRSMWSAFQSINLVSAVAMMVFTISGFVMTGIAGQVVDYLHSYQFLPLGLSFGALALAFASSDTRDPRYYHPAEWGIVLGTGAMMGLHAFVPQVTDLVANNNPHAGLGVVAIMLVCSAIVAR